MESLRSEEIIKNLKAELEEKDRKYQECRSQLRLAHTQLQYKDMALQGIINSNVNLHEKMTELTRQCEVKESGQREVHFLKEEMARERDDFTKQLTESRSLIESLTKELYKCKEPNLMKPSLLLRESADVCDGDGDVDTKDNYDNNGNHDIQGDVVSNKLFQDIVKSLNNTSSTSTENLQGVLRRSLESFMSSSSSPTEHSDIFKTIYSFLNEVKQTEAEVELEQKKEIVEEIETSQLDLYNKNNGYKDNVIDDSTSVEHTNTDEEMTAIKKRARRQRRRQNAKAKKWAEKSQADTSSPQQHRPPLSI